MKEKTGLKDYKLDDICLDDKVSLYGLKGVVVKGCGAYGIAFDETIPWNLLYRMIIKETGCDNEPYFCDNDNFISFWEIAWNYNCEENYLSMVEIIN